MLRVEFSNILDMGFLFPIIALIFGSALTVSANIDRPGPLDGKGNKTIGQWCNKVACLFS